MHYFYSIIKSEIKIKKYLTMIVNISIIIDMLRNEDKT